ncbi:hypothetical protein BGW37DRAFT_473380 [Umbelopsis sp. PMI_123]|nr:hypothetical protein BGW37DRAFT_473380 [Umbelopsis sp. PMI_123]
MDHTALHMNHSDDHHQVNHLSSGNNNRPLDNDNQNVSDLFDLSNNISYLFAEGSAHNYASLIPNSGLPNYTYNTAGGSGGSAHSNQPNLTSAIDDFSASSRIDDMQKTTSTAAPGSDAYANKEDMLTPLMSPAMTPSFHGSRQPDTTHMISRDTHFSPLASPAMVPQNDATNSMRQQDQVHDYMTISNESMQEHYQRLEEAKMALEEQLWKLKSKQSTTQPYNNPRKRPSPNVSTVQAPSSVQAEINQSAINTFPSTAKSPRPDPTSMRQEPPRMSPATPASLMNMSISPTPGTSGKKNRKRTGSKASVTQVKGMQPPQTSSPSLQPTASSSSVIRQVHSTPPSLKPRLNSILASPRTLKPLLTSPTMTPTFGSASTDEAARILAAKSNYQNLREGKTAALGINFSPGIHSGIEIRRSAHKAAEQKRRDNLKEWFDRLRVELEDGYFDTLEHMNDEKDQPKDNKIEDSKRPNVTKIETDDANGNDADGNDADGTGDYEKSQNDESSSGTTNAGTKQPMSKVLLLQYSYEYIVKLKSELRERDEKINDLESAMSKR